jgi:hypothetical protein
VSWVSAVVVGSEVKLLLRGPGNPYAVN